MAQRKVDIITLGCSKNLVDSERLIGLFAANGIAVRHDPDEEQRPSPTVVINTCGFIGDAKEESVNTILQYAQAKNDGKIKELYVMGCLSQRYSEELPVEIPEVDGWYGKFNWHGIVDRMVKNASPGSTSFERVITTPSHHAYIKISEGCNRYCAFCAIPLITGRYKSRTIDDILAEIEALVARGVKEFNVIAQDLSSYGIDIYGRMALPELIDRMAGIKGVEWIRLHYAYPAQFPMEIADVMARRPNVCKYIDIALQHISDPVLKAMRRHIDAAGTRALLAELRKRVPGIHIRTTLMVGFPGEGETEFDELIDFVKEQRFERMGAFAYCEEDDTFAAQNLADSIPDRVKQDRLSRLMALQEQISLEKQEEKIGNTLRVLIDREEDDYYVGRTEWDSPEVDPEVLVKKTRKLQRGEFCNVRVVQAFPFELIAEIV
ncbi:30S ribosomal protein S12 methylthiotransferase RimO [Muribaculum sp.]|jgi:ribosomal protein S12 methylthiotransferase|uniref:30S ribosomal protein S12 methylthiotransferase RimO n=1 Tax=Muribaculum sp. TaxID=1918611 RepID=UPI00257C1562|nr:30S ribosomal protein S12 methylthiotransferase RimO [Muribaculum sp.]